MNGQSYRRRRCRLALTLLLLGAAAAARGAGQAPTPATYRRLAGEAETNLRTQVLAKWFPRAVDEARGGFRENFNEDWSPGPNAQKSLVYQSRLTWVAAAAALRYPRQAAAYREDARHGLAFLAGTLWDRQQGGFYWAVGADGRPDTDRGTEKHVYGIAFALYAATAEYRATRDPRALDLARRGFRWLEAHAHDARSGGYFEALTRGGTPILTPPPAPAASSDAIGTRYGFKSMNTHIHLLEALTALHEVWPDPLVTRRLRETFGLVRDRIAVAPGCLNLFFTPGWRPVPDSDSFGHDVETAYLLTEASAALGAPEDARTWRIARSLVDHALAFGWDAANGGFYDRGSAFEPATGLDKIWWTQAEGLNALLLMHARYGRGTSRYWDAFRKQWAFIQAHQVDHRYGGWYATVSKEGAAPPGHVKSDAWTEAYHQGRALFNVTARLRRLAGRAAP